MQKINQTSTFPTQNPSPTLNSDIFGMFFLDYHISADITNPKSEENIQNPPPDDNDDFVQIQIQEQTPPPDVKPKHKVAPKGLFDSIASYWTSPQETQPEDTKVDSADQIQKDSDSGNPIETNIDLKEPEVVTSSANYTNIESQF